MPGYNGTGPMSAGPMTGGRRGPCNMTNAGYERLFPETAGFGRGMGYGRAFRGGLGSGMRHGFGRGRFQYQPIDTGNFVDELNSLKAEAETARNILETINRKIMELEKAQ